MKYNLNFIIVFFLIFNTKSYADKLHTKRMPRYVGSFFNSYTKTEQLVKLDLIPVQNEGKLDYIAFLTFFFGDFSSKEYITYHFDGATFDLETSTFAFDQPDQAITFVAQKRNDDFLEGSIISSIEGEIGTLSLKKTWTSSVDVHSPITPFIFNEYKGICRNKEATLQIQTMRSADDTIRVGNPFGAYSIKAQYGEDMTSNGCFGVDAPCVKYLYDYGSYNFFRGELNLFGRMNNLTCHVKKSGLDCNGCIFIPTKGFRSKKSVRRFPYAKAFWEKDDFKMSLTDSKIISSVAGRYNGLLHHEYLDTYQDISLQMTTIPKDKDGKHMFVVSSIASLYFGPLHSTESLHYKFKPSKYQPFRNIFVLENIENDTDALLVLEEINGQMIRGSWYSILFGRVGSFLVQKNTSVSFPENLKKIGSIFGKYIGPKWILDLKLSRESTPINTQNPFFPLNFRGYTFLNGIPDFNNVVGGTYDFYTGKIGLHIEDGSFFFGERKDDTTLHLKRPTPGVLRPLLSNSLQKFIKERASL